MCAYDDGRTAACASTSRHLGVFDSRTGFGLVGKRALVDGVAEVSHSRGDVVEYEDPSYRNVRHIVDLGQLE